MTRDLGPDLVVLNAAGMITMQGRPELETGLTALAIRDSDGRRGKDADRPRLEVRSPRT